MTIPALSTTPLQGAEFKALLTCDSSSFEAIRVAAVESAQRVFGNGIFVRGLIEISSHCKNNCLYCGLRRDNTSVERYRLTESQILECCKRGYNLGLRTFVLQGGEDGFWSDARLVPLVEKIATLYPDAAITLSLGERSKESYKALFSAGATRYLLRHEAADSNLYSALHPGMSFSNRMRCIENLLEIGFQTGVGMMIGVPGQTIDHIVRDIEYIARLRPQMVGIGPFIPHSATPFASNSAGDIGLTLRVVSLIRIALPGALIPATTALSTLSKEGHKAGIRAGANVIMPNLSPADVRNKYAIYEGKASSGCEAAEGLKSLEEELESFGYRVNYDRGDYNYVQI